MRVSRTVSFVVALVALTGVSSAPAAEDIDLLQTHSRSSYVHRITLYDHDGMTIEPSDPLAGPYSPMQTCGKCHPVAQIRHGWHFNENFPDARAGRPGEPWTVVDPNTPTVLAVSGRGWPNTQTPADAGLSYWSFIQTFGRHMPGGSYGTPTDEQVANSDESIRWSISGPLEIDCMVCHCADQSHDPAEAARQIAAENTKWAATAALGLATIRGEAKKMPDDWDPLMPPNPDHPEQAGPQMEWDAGRFDADGRVLFSITRRIPNQRCYFCHTVRAVGPRATHETITSRDVHLAAGLLCVDCHTNSVDHRIVRGYADEPTITGEPERIAYTCRGCHLGTTPIGEAGEHVEPIDVAAHVALGGRYGAPHPQHRGFPTLHFEELSCTACHSGPWPEEEPRTVQTALAHGLGLASRERTADTPPFIVAPIFARLDADGPITPLRMLVGTRSSDAVRWPLAHDVRPARQSLGINGCEDCHSSDAPIYFGKTLPSSLAPANDASASHEMHELYDYDTTLATLFAVGFVTRPAFKIYGFIAAAILGLILFRLVGDVFHRTVFQACPAKPSTTPVVRTHMNAFETIAHGFATLGVIVQVASGFGAIALTGGAPRGYWLLGHMAGAGLLILGLTIVALQWARRCRVTLPNTGLNRAQRWIFWISLATGLGLMLTMLSAMLPVFGYAAQHALVELHEKFAIAMIAVMIIHTAVSLSARRCKTKPTTVQTQES